MAKRIVCIGDSNTWGYDPRGWGGGRYPAAVRWTARLDALPQWAIVNEGENGREIPRGAASLGRLLRQVEAAAPDGACVLLGTNDLLCGASPAATADRMDGLLDALSGRSVPLLLLAPPPLQPGAWTTDALCTASAALGARYAALAQRRGLAFADTAAWAIELAFDGVHFTEQGHARFAERAQAVFTAAFGV
ncbi:MAG: GDSL-type esterase/lipase family protein [Eubacteriales bacterium]|nr:GDSL-type esterase/lipase family protein [Eubacteriales bacterium]